MKKLKQALSLTLALALSLVVPTFAVAPDQRNIDSTSIGSDAGFNLSVQGKSDEEITLPSSTYKQRNWDYDWKGDELISVYTKSEEIRDLAAETLVGLSRGDTMILTAKNIDFFELIAWSDPDGDGIYERRLYGYTDLDSLETIPTTVDSVISHGALGDQIYVFDIEYDDSYVLAPDGKLAIKDRYDWDEDKLVDTVVSADDLFQEFGPNTILRIQVYYNYDYYVEETMPGLGGQYQALGIRSWYVLLMDDEQPTSPAEPEQPSTPAAPSAPVPTSVVLSPQNLAVDGKTVECEKYNIDGSNYFKLRDLAQLLNGTGSQFGVGFDAATSTVAITTGQAYESTGTELAAGVDNSATTQPSSQSILINGAAHSELTVYNIGGSNFFQLRELGNLLGFEVGYDVDTNTATVTSVQ